MGEDRRADVRRTTVAEAADQLGISAEAVRGRVRRGTLRVEREDGKVYVLLDRAQPDRTTADQPRTTADQPTDRTELVEELRDRVRSLERMLDQEREARTEERRRHDTLMAQLTQANAALAARIPEQLEAPSSEATEPEAPASVEETPEAPEPQPDTVSPKTAPQSPQRGTLRGLRRRILGW